MYTQYPPGLDSPLLYLVAVFALMLGVLLAAEWLWRLIWSFIERPQPFKSPTTALRLVLSILLVGALVRAVPRLWLFMRWPLLTPDQREALATLTAQAEITAVAVFCAAWLIGLLGEPIIKYQLEKEPIPLHLWPTRRQLARPLKIGGGVFVIAFALTYLR